MMQLNCPTCGNLIQASHINVHDKIAVCANCDTVFDFTLPKEKAKRRKVKQPHGLTLTDGRMLNMSFRTNWRLDSSEAFITSTFGAGMAFFLASFMALSAFAGETSIYMPMGFIGLALLMSYITLLTVFNHTQITMDDLTISVKREPLPSLLNNETKISLNGVETIQCAETEASKEHNYDTPRYIIWAQTVDGNRRPIVTDLVEDYAYYVTQKLNEQLQGYDISHLEDRAYDSGQNYDEDTYQQTMKG